MKSEVGDEVGEETSWGLYDTTVTISSSAPPHYYFHAFILSRQFQTLQRIMPERRPFNRSDSLFKAILCTSFRI